MELDLHVHSRYSFDSISNPEKILKIARKKGLDGIAITDHNTIKGGIIASQVNIKDFFTIIGSEIGTEAGDIIGLFLNEEIKSRTLLEVIDEIKAQDGIAVLAHPFRRANEINDGVIKRIDVIEAFNARNKKSANIMAKNLALKHNLPMIAGSDAHFYFEIGRARTIINADDHEISNIKRSILTNNTKLSGKESSYYINLFSKSIRIIKTRKLPERFRIWSKLK